ncbi:hypothetical protein [Streptosporangium sp. NPDC000396]|uniref:hypothetical protein n=1 Tax=Streptosporangium sp. NPDC000396 TaxID=3366185 RepID=UPI0036B4803D
MTDRLTVWSSEDSSTLFWFVGHPAQREAIDQASAKKAAEAAHRIAEQLAELDIARSADEIRASARRLS